MNGEHPKSDVPTSKQNLTEVLADIDVRFTSGNSVPVERASIRGAEWHSLRGAIRNQRAALAGLIEAIRSVEISSQDWQEHVGDRLARAYQAVGPGLFPQEIAALESSRVETAAEPPPTAQWLAVQFHETYERLAPKFGYETRRGTRHFDPESPNGRLMMAVCAELLTREPALNRPAVEPSPLQSDTDHLMQALVKQEGVLNACEALLCEAINDEGINAGFDERLAVYWKRSAALASSPDEPGICIHSLKGHAGDKCPECGDGPCPHVNGDGK